MSLVSEFVSGRRRSCLRTDQPTQSIASPGGLGRRWRCLSPPTSLFPNCSPHPRDGGWAGFLLAQVDFHGRCYGSRIAWRFLNPADPSVGNADPKPHPRRSEECRGLWAMEEGCRCCSFAVMADCGAIPKALRFTATRLAVATGGDHICLAGWCGSAALQPQQRAAYVGESPAAPAIPGPFDPRAPGLPASTGCRTLPRAWGFAGSLEYHT